MSKNSRLELNWIGKEKRPRLEPRILVEDTEEKVRNPAITARR
jgi:adenine-specific DNA-methyltransferase